MIDTQSPHSLAAQFVRSKIRYLITCNNQPKIRAILARLRRGISNMPGADPDIWEMTLAELPEDLLSKNGIATPAEWAVHIALTLFALHQQGTDIQTNCMHRESLADDKVKLYSFGNAIRRLAGSPDSDNYKSIKRRFNATVTSESIEEFTHHLRSMIQLLKSASIPLDYVQLTRELVLFQKTDNRDSLRLKWGQDFYRNSSKTE